jgi:hypothetical protein
LKKISKGSIIAAIDASPKVFGYCNDGKVALVDWGLPNMRIRNTNNYKLSSLEAFDVLKSKKLLNSEFSANEYIKILIENFPKDVTSIKNSSIGQLLNKKVEEGVLLCYKIRARNFYKNI